MNDLFALVGAEGALAHEQLQLDGLPLLGVLLLEASPHSLPRLPGKVVVLARLPVQAVRAPLLAVEAAAHLPDSHAPEGQPLHLDKVMSISPHHKCLRGAFRKHQKRIWLNV